MTHDETLTSDHPITTGERARRHWLVGISAAAVGVLAAGTVGYTFGQAADDPNVAAPAIALPSGSPLLASDARPGSVGAPEPAPAGDQRLGVDMMPYSYGRIVFTSSGLSGDAGSTTAWAYDPAQTWSKQTAARAATALGLGGDPTLVDGSWIVGAKDGSGPMLSLSPDGMSSVISTTRPRTHTSAMLRYVKRRRIWLCRWIQRSWEFRRSRNSPKVRLRVTRS